MPQHMWPQPKWPGSQLCRELGFSGQTGNGHISSGLYRFPSPITQKQRLLGLGAVKHSMQVGYWVCSKPSWNRHLMLLCFKGLWCLNSLVIQWVVPDSLPCKVIRFWGHTLEKSKKCGLFQAHWSTSLHW